MVTHSIAGLSKVRRERLAVERPANFTGMRARLLGCMLICAAGALTPVNAAKALSCPAPEPLDRVSSTPPSDFCSPIAVTQEADFYALSWQLFKFLVWPAKPGSRGVPDDARKIFDMEGPRVFETYKADWEVFRPNADDPDDWSAHPSSPCSNDQDIKPGALVLARRSKFENLSVGSSFVLIAQNGTYVRYQVSYNEELFGSIRRNKLYDPRESRDLKLVPPGKAINPKATAPDGAIVLKSAWIELPENVSPPPAGSPRYYVQDNAWVQIPGARECRRTSVGLVGLHIVYKTKDRPQWIWSSFEHVANVPEDGDQPGMRYTFNNGSNTPMQPPGDDYRVSRQIRGQVPPPYQVERGQKIAADAVSMNLDWQAKFKEQNDSVWQNYKLVTTQWLQPRRAPDEDIVGHTILPLCGGDQTPATANTTMETFQQVCTRETMDKVTCLGCHNGARATDHIFSIRLNARAPAGFDARSGREEIVKKVEDILNQIKLPPSRSTRP